MLLRMISEVFGEDVRVTLLVDFDASNTALEFRISMAVRVAQGSQAQRVHPASGSQDGITPFETLIS